MGVARKLRHRAQACRSPVRGHQVAAVPILLEHTAEELNAVLGTMSFWKRLSPRRRNALATANTILHQRLGQPIRSSTVACLGHCAACGPHLTG
jgi:hypothetical protein